MLYSTIKRDLILVHKNIHELIAFAFFYIIVVSLFPLALAADEELVSMLAPSIIWVCALLSSINSVSLMYLEDYNDGSLELMYLHGKLPEIIVLTKILSHWIVSGWPIIILSLCMAYILEIKNILGLASSLFVGTLVLSSITSIIASITLGIKRSGGIIGLLFLPLNIPVLIFAIGTVKNDDYLSGLIMLIGLFLFIFPLSLFSSSLALRSALSDS